MQKIILLDASVEFSKDTVFGSERYVSSEKIMMGEELLGRILSKEDGEKIRITVTAGDKSFCLEVK